MPKRRGHGDGALFYSQSRQRWVARLELPPTPTGRRRQREVSGRTRAAALARLRQVRDDLNDGKAVNNRHMTVGDLLERWLERGLPNLSEAARANTHWAVEKHLVPALGARRLAELSPEDIEDWLAGLARPKLAPAISAGASSGVDARDSMAGYSRSTIARLHGTLTRALAWGQARGYVTRNVSRLVITPTGPTKQRRALTVAEARRLLDAAATDPMGAAVACGLLLGLRPGELIALRWEDVDLGAGTVTVRRYLKTRASHRTLRMPRRLVDVLIAHAAEQMTCWPHTSHSVDVGGPRQAQDNASHALANHASRLDAWPDASTDRADTTANMSPGSDQPRRLTMDKSIQEHEKQSSPQDNGLVFATAAGTPLDRANLRRALRRIATRAGLPTLTPYELRHSAVSILSAAGVPLELVADVAGHSGPRTTADVYRHSITPSVDAAATVMDQALG